MAQVGNWTEERSSTQGQGDVTLSGALSGSTVRLRDSLQTGEAWYSISNGNNREAGVTTFDGVDKITRNDVRTTFENGIYNSSNPSPINLVGASVVSCTFNTSAFQELEIGNPPVDGYVLSSTIAGVRNWIDATTGGVTAWGSLTGDFRNQTDLVNNFTAKIANVATLRSTDGVTDGRTVSMISYTTSGDGGGGDFYWDAASTATDNGVTIFKVASVTSGRWLRPDLSSATLKMAGCIGDGVTNDAIRMQAAFDALEVVYVNDNTEFFISAAVVPPQSLKKISGKGTILVGDNIGINILGVALETLTVTNINDNRDVSDPTNTIFSTRVTVSTVGSASVGDKVRLYGDSSQSLYTEIQDISGNIFTLSDKLTFSIGANPQIDRIPEHDITISDVTFKHTPASIAAGSYIINVGRIHGLVVEDCIFESVNPTITRVMSNIGGACVIRNNKFNNVSLAIQLFDSGQVVVDGNKITNFKQAIRCVRTHETKIINNRISNGLNQSFGIGIELTGETTSFDKNCWNLVEGNTVINANHGVAGSAIGGIHLNFGGDHNIIKGNTVKRCSIGIYLENDSSYNTIVGNNCSYNDGYYGVGIELDFNNNYNTISDNVCNYNQGSITAFESSGIQLRSNRTSSNVQFGNIVSDNECNFNGLEGIRANGIGLVVEGNSCISNGQMVESFNAARGIYVDGLRVIVKGNYVYQNVFDSRATSAYVQVCLQINNSKNILVMGNIFKGISFSENAILAEQATGELMDNIKIEHNIIDFSGAAGNAIKIIGFDATEMADFVNISNNTIDMTNNGLASIASNFLNNYTVFNNSYPTYKSLALGADSTNRVTPADD